VDFMMLRWLPKTGLPQIWFFWNERKLKPCSPFAYLFSCLVHLLLTFWLLLFHFFTILLQRIFIDDSLKIENQKSINNAECCRKALRVGILNYSHFKKN
jgi:hypothetical protein